MNFFEGSPEWPTHPIRQIVNWLELFILCLSPNNGTSSNVSRCSTDIGHEFVVVNSFLKKLVVLLKCVLTSVCY